MAGSKFQYDESGGTFFYFLLSFLALVVIPCTYYFWPQESSPETNGKRIKLITRFPLKFPLKSSCFTIQQMRKSLLRRRSVGVKNAL